MAKAENSSDNEDLVQGESDRVQNDAEAEIVDTQNRQEDIVEERAKKDALTRELLKLSRRSLSLRKSAYLAANSTDRLGF